MITIYLAPITANERRRLRRWAAGMTPDTAGLWTARLVKVYFWKDSEWGEDAIALSSNGVADLSEVNLAGVALHEVACRLGRHIENKIVCEHVAPTGLPADWSFNLAWAEEYTEKLKARIPLPDGCVWSRPKPAQRSA